MRAASIWPSYPPQHPRHRVRDRQEMGWLGDCLVRLVAACVLPIGALALAISLAGVISLVLAIGIWLLGQAVVHRVRTVFRAGQIRVDLS